LPKSRAVLERDLDLAKANIVKITAILHKLQLSVTYVSYQAGHQSGYTYVPSAFGTQKPGFIPKIATSAAVLKSSADSLVCPSLDEIYVHLTVEKALP